MRESNMSYMHTGFSMSQLEMALNNTASSASGIYYLHYAMFRQLPDEALQMILKLFTKVWNESK